MKPTGLDGVALGELGHRLDGQRRHLETVAAASGCKVTEERAERRPTGRLFFAERDQQQAVRRLDAPPDEPEGIQRRIVGPMRILDDHQGRCRHQLVEERPEQLDAARLGSEDRGDRRHVVKRGQCLRCDQRLATAPQHTPRRWLLIHERPGDAGFPDARLAAQQHHGPGPEPRFGEPRIEVGEELRAFDELHRATVPA